MFEMGRVRHLPGQHFKDEDAQGPPVHCPAVTFALDDFRGQVLRSAAQSPGPDWTQTARTCLYSIEYHNYIVKVVDIFIW